MYNEIPLVVLALALSACSGTQGTSGYAGTDGKSSCQKITTQAEINGKVEPITGVACQQSDGTWQLMQNTDRSYYGYPYGYYDPWYWGPYGFSTQLIFVDRIHHHHHFSPGSMQHSSVAAGGAIHSGVAGAGAFHSGGMRR